MTVVNQLIGMVFRHHRGAFDVDVINCICVAFTMFAFSWNQRGERVMACSRFCQGAQPICLQLHCCKRCQIVLGAAAATEAG